MLEKVIKEKGQKKKKAEAISENIIKQPEVLTHALIIQSWKLGHRRENDRKSEKFTAFSNM